MSGSAGRFGAVLPWSRLEALVSDDPLGWVQGEDHGGIERPRLALLAWGRAVAPDALLRAVPAARGGFVQRVDPSRLAAHIDAGATLAVDGVDELVSSVGAVAAAIESALGERVRASAYASWHPTPGLARHFDVKDVFVAQTVGRKRWRVWAPVPGVPVSPEPAPPTGDPTWEAVIEAGDLLYLPRGWWHEAAAFDGPSLHVTFGVFRPTGLDLLRWLGTQLGRADALDRELPREGSDSARRKRSAEIRQAVAEALDDGVVERFLAVHGADVELRRPRPALPVVDVDEGDP